MRTIGRTSTVTKTAGQGKARFTKPLIEQLPVHLLFIPLTFLWVYPFLWMVSSSFKSQSEMFLNGLSLIPDRPTFENYTRAWHLAQFGQYTLNTVAVTTAVVLLVVLISSLAGYALGRGRMPGKRLILGILVVTMFLPKGFTILPVFVLVNALGLNNTLFGVILAESGPAHIPAILLFMGYFAALPQDLEEAALVDGASHPRIYAQIMLPLAKPVIGTVALFNFVAAWNSFLVPLVFTLGAPELRTLGVGIYAFFGENSIDWTGLAAGSVIAVLPIIAVFLWLQRFFIDGLAGAVKG